MEMAKSVESGVGVEEGVAQANCRRPPDAILAPCFYGFRMGQPKASRASKSNAGCN